MSEFKNELVFKVPDNADEYKWTDKLNLKELFTVYDKEQCAQILNADKTGEYIRFIQVGDRYYQVDWDTFEAAKDLDLILKQPEHMIESMELLISKGAVPVGIETVDYTNASLKDIHKSNVRNLALKGDLLNQMLERKNQAISHLEYIGIDNKKRCLISCEVDGVEQPMVHLNETDTQRFKKLEKQLVEQDYSDQAEQNMKDFMLDMATRYYSKVVFAPLLKKTMDNPERLTDKINAVLKAFFSPEEVVKIRHAITNPDKSVEDVEELLKAIHQKEEVEEDMITKCPEDNLKPEDAKTYVDFDKALKEKFPQGTTFYVPDLIGEEIFSYIMYNYSHKENWLFTPVGQEPQFTEYLKAEVRVKPEDLYRLMPANDYNENMQVNEFIESLPDAELYDAGTTNMLMKHPDLEGAVLEGQEEFCMEHLFVEGRPLSDAISVMLQKHDISDVQLKGVLTDWVAEQAFIILVSQDKDKGLQHIKNSNYIYFYEPGVLGHARVDRMRGVTYSGETLSMNAQRHINNFALNKNVESSRHNEAFFYNPGTESSLKLYLDTMKNEMHKIYTQQDMDGRTMYTEGNKIVSEDYVKSLQDITGRITHATITDIKSPMIRCKIDGEWQLAQKLNKSEICKMPHFSKPEEMDSFALSVAARHYATELYDTLEQKQTMGVKR